ITDIALPCIGVKPEEIDKSKYYRMTGIGRCIMNEEGMKVPALEVKSYEEADAPKDELVTFN
ncbi:MAG: hypothetical protein J5365_03460, partial [Erysipelotrichaceae bacterium]|nr:hypothetical protein [Erysipelotrichaceae bacterium]